MLTKEQILKALADMRISQTDIGRAINIHQTAVSKLYKGSRELTYDEGYQLVERFKLEQREPIIPARLLAPLLQIVVPLAPKGDQLSDEAAQALAEVLQYGAALLQSADATDPTAREYALATQAMLREFERSWLQ